MKFNRSNIIFGTANLCSKYGHKSKFISESKSRGMLDFAYKKEISLRGFFLEVKRTQE